MIHIGSKMYTKNGSFAAILAQSFKGICGKRRNIVGKASNPHGSTHAAQPAYLCGNHVPIFNVSVRREPRRGAHEILGFDENKLFHAADVVDVVEVNAVVHHLRKPPTVDINQIRYLNLLIPLTKKGINKADA